MTPEVSPPHPVLVVLGETIQTRRKELGMSQRTLAQQTAFSVVYLRSVERGQRNVSLLAFLRIAKVLQLNPAAVVAALAPLYD